MATITTISNTSLATITPEGSQEVTQGSSFVCHIETDDISSIYVEDNDVDVTSQLVYEQKPNTGETTTVLGTYTLISGSFNGQGGSYFQGIVGKGVGGTQTTSNYYSTSSSVIAIFTYDLGMTIPSNAIVTRLYCEVNGHAESTTNANEYMCVQLILDTSANTISNETNFKSLGTSNTTTIVEATTLPTVAQLTTLKLKCRLGYYGGAINGATCHVEYTIPEGGSYWYTYTLSNVSANHAIVVQEPYVPPEEDPTKTYYSVTVSSVNATTNPGSGTTRVESGTSQTVTITPTDPQLTLAMDNGVDITNQLVAHSGLTPSSSQTAVQGAQYGFVYCADTGYYTSQNKGVHNSAAITRITLNLPSRSLVTIEYINYAEATYDYGIFGKVDTALSTGYTVDDTSLTQLICNTNAYNVSTPQTLTYEINSGSHFIDVKFRKDTNQNTNNDNLQFKIASITELEPSTYYTYALSNINQDHSLVFVFGSVTYYFVNASKTGDAKLFPNGQMVQFPGDDYKLIIVPDNTGAIVSITDNGVDATSSLERKEIDTVKEGTSVHAVNYIYRLNNIQTAHTLNVTVSAPTGFNTLVKVNGTWRESRAVYKKVNGSWVQQEAGTNVFSPNKIYLSGN